MSDKWTISDPETEGDWVVEVDTDCFSTERHFVVMLSTEDGDGGDTLVELPADVAREIASALLKHADNVDANNRRVADYAATKEGNPND